MDFTPQKILSDGLAIWTAGGWAMWPMLADTAVAVAFLASRGIELPPHPSEADMKQAFAELVSEEMPPIDRDMKLIKVAMSAAPLWGLLGTVTGMLTTFKGLASGGGGDKTMDVVAKGISEALITTETGLMIAIPGYFLHYYIARRRDQFDAFITHLETVATQHFLLVREGNDPVLAAGLASADEPEDDSPSSEPRTATSIP
jgi:biopolymer transport protein ExbB/TolQ